MKRRILSFLALISLSGAYSQNVNEAILHSTNELYGTSRFKGLSGAMGAVGGDLSSIGVNPAASAVFSSSEVAISLGNINNNFSNNYFGTDSFSKASDFYLGQLGIVISTGYNPNSNWRRFSFAINNEKTRNFSDKEYEFYTGDAKTGLAEYFLNSAQGIPQQNLMTQEYENKKEVANLSIRNLYELYSEAEIFSTNNLRNAFLAYQTYLIKPSNGVPDYINESFTDELAEKVLNHSDYEKTVSKIKSQNYEQTSSGRNGKYAFNFAAQYGNNLFLGTSINAHYTYYSKTEQHNEFYNDTEQITSARYNTSLRTTGSGISFQFGAIYRMQDMRFGLSYTSPTWNTLTDEFSQSISSRGNKGDIFTADPNYIVLYSPYVLRTPGNVTASFAYIFKNRGFINLDFSYKDYSNTKFASNGLKSMNQILSEEFRSSSTTRLGGEFRLNKLIYLRAGARLETSPYKNKEIMGDLIGYSCGLGLSLDGIRFDLSYDRASQKTFVQPQQEYFTPAFIKASHSNILLSASIKLF